MSNRSAARRPTRRASSRKEFLVSAGLFLYFDALPERDVILNLLCRRLGVGVKPCGIRIGFAVHLDVVVARGALPGTLRVFRARLEIFALDRVGRKVLIAFHFNGLVRFRKDRVFPDCFRHSR
jgi:hypothetical protein